MKTRIVAVGLLVSSAAFAALPDSLTLEEALTLSHEHQPTLRQMQAASLAAEARARQSLSPLLPTVTANVGYSRSTGNFVARPGAIPSGVDTSTTTAPQTISLNSSDYWNAGITASVTAWDFLQTYNRWQASLSTAQAQAASEKSTRRTSDYSVRTLFFAAASQKKLLEVAEAALVNTRQHLEYTQGTVTVGSKPEIDLAQAKADTANARLALLNAKNAYSVSRAKLNQAMGVEVAPTYDVVGGEPGEVEGESNDINALMPEAMGARPEAEAIQAQVHAQELTLRAVKADYLPTLGVTLNGTLASRSLPTVVPNLSVQATINWALFEGGLTLAQQREAEATLRSLEAQRDGLRLQVRMDLEQALLDVSTAREGVSVAGEATAAAKEKLRLAEGRYKAGAGNALELSDAQIAATQAAGQEVQAQFTLSTARAALVAALGRI